MTVPTATRRSPHLGVIARTERKTVARIARKGTGAATRRGRGRKTDTGQTGVTRIASVAMTKQVDHHRMNDQNQHLHLLMTSAGRVLSTTHAIDAVGRGAIGIGIETVTVTVGVSQLRTLRKRSARGSMLLRK